MSSLHGLTPKAKARRFRALLPDHRGLQDADVLNIEFFGGRQGLLLPVPDPRYTVRAWRAVVTYLLRRQEFLYE